MKRRNTSLNWLRKTVTYSNDKKQGVELKKIVHSDLFEAILENTDDTNVDVNGYWLKFEGTGEDRIPNQLNYQEMKGIRRRDLTQTFPRRPGGIQKDNTLFLTIVSYDELDRPTPMIVGYAKTDGFRKENVVDDADIKDSPWKLRFPYYVEFSAGKVINAPIKNGFRLVDLYNSVGKSTFPSLRKRSIVSQKTLQSMHFRRSHIRVTQEAYDFLMSELNKRFSKHGEINFVV